MFQLVSAEVQGMRNFKLPSSRRSKKFYRGARTRRIGGLVLRPTDFSGADYELSVNYSNILLGIILLTPPPTTEASAPLLIGF